MAKNPKIPACTRAQQQRLLASLRRKRFGWVWGLFFAKQARSFWYRLRRSLSRRRKALRLQRKWAQNMALAAEKRAALADPNSQPGPSTVSPHTRVLARRSYKKMAVIRFLYWSQGSLWFKSNGRTRKLRKGLRRRRVQKVPRDHQEKRQEGFEGGTCSSFPPSGPNSPSHLPQAPFPDMDCSAPGPTAKVKDSDIPNGSGPEPCGGGTFPSQQNGNVALNGQTSESLSPEQRSRDLFISKTAPEIIIVESDDQSGDSGDEKLNLPDEAASGEELVYVKTVQTAGSPGPAEAEAARPQTSFNDKSLDLLLCETPQKAPSQQTRFKGGQQVGGEKSGQKASSIKDEELSSFICGFLDEVMKKYGSLFPLCEEDVLGKLKDFFNKDFNNRKPFVNQEIKNYQARHPRSSSCNFRVHYKANVLYIQDLETLEGRSWLNDQVINMYGELIMNAFPDKVHFFNSFFYKQLATKGYSEVKRWTKKEDLFKKKLLLIPVHMKNHWVLTTVTLSNQIISFYNSQGIYHTLCVDNIKKYLQNEAKEKNQPEFLQGWQMPVLKDIPQQKNSSDCGVFVLQYCKCLAFDRPFKFSQEDMPQVRKRIYKELCECRLLD